LRGQESGDRDGRPEQEQPERESVQAGEGDVGSADLQRQDGVREAGEERGREHEQHDRAVHREQLVVLLLRRDDLHPRCEELRTDDQRHHAAEEEEHHRCDQIHVSDRLVVGGGDPLDHDVALLLHPSGGEQRGLPRRNGLGAGSRLRSSRKSGRHRGHFPSSLAAPVPGRLFRRS
ncbi:hypothetical protein ABE10_02595, partial [Bacillus toyonensis]|nr:hypothetical protein [Bacillus toyonensis]